MAITDNLDSYYTFNGHVNDLVGSNDGAVTGAILATGKVGRGYDFDGTDDYITLTGNNIAGNPAFSYSFWVYKTGGAETEVLLVPTGTGSNSPTTAFHPNVQSNNKIRIILFNNEYLETANAITDSTWTHVVITKAAGAPASTTKIYIDGSEETLTIVGGTATPTYPSADLLVGQEVTGYGGNHFDGIIDEVGVWSKVLSSTEVTTLYNSGNGKTFFDGAFVDAPNMKEEIVGYYPLDESTGSVRDVSMTGYSGKVGNAFDFNGTDDKFVVSDDSSLRPSNLSISLWVNGDSWVSPESYLLSRKFENYELRVSNEGRIKAYVGDGTNYIEASDASSAVLDTNSWHHVVMTVDGSDVKIYVDGSLDFSDTQTYALSTTNVADLWVGERNGGSVNIEGKLDEIGIWGKVLSPTEITSLYNSGNGKAYADLTTGEKTNLVSYYSLDETSDPLDAHGTNDGELSGATNSGATRGATGKIDNCFDFDGTADKVNNVDTELDINYPTLSAWVNIDDFAGSSAIVSKALGTAGENYWEMRIETTGYVRCVSTRTAGTLTVDSASALSTGTWYHLVFVSNPEGLYIYVDGTLSNSVANTNPLKTGVYQKLAIGYDSPIVVGDRWFTNGKIDEVGIWDRSLTADEISDLYNAGSGSAYPFITTTQITKDGKARLQIADTEKTQTGTARIQIDDTEEVYDSDARINLTIQKLKDGTANIQILDTEITKDGKAFLSLEKLKTSNADARVAIQNFIEKTGAAYISTGAQIIKDGTARIQILDNEKYLVGTARLIIEDKELTKQGNARISLEDQTKVSTGEAFISLEITYTKEATGTSFVAILDDFKPTIKTSNSTKPKIRSAETFN